MKWLAKNWIKISIVIGIILIAIGVIGLMKDNERYKRDIENLDIDIQRLEVVNDVKEGIIVDLRTKRAEDKVAAGKEIADIKENQKRELARIGREREEERVRVENLPASEVVVETKIILIQRAKENVAIEIWERPEGILFSLDTAKTNLAILVDFSLVEEERDQWKDDYNKAMDVIKKKDKIIAGDDFIFFCFEAVTFNLKEISKKKDEKFNKSEKRNVQSWWRGAKTGGLIFGIIGFIGGFVLGR